MLWFKCDEIIPGVSIGIAFIAICLSGFLFVHEADPFLDVDGLCRMAEAPEAKRTLFKEMGKTAFILGYTGETGQLVTRLLGKEKLFKKVTLIGRRTVKLDETIIGPEFEQKVIDFDKLDNYADVFKDHDVGIVCLGTTRGKSGAEGFVKVDHDYVLKCAEHAKSGGTKHLQFMSTYAADHNSSQLYTRTKGQVEEALKVMHFERLSIFRPAILLVDRHESRPLEAMARFLLKPVAYMFPTAITIPAETVAHAFINNIITPTNEKVELFENKAVHVMGGKSGHCGKK